MYLVTCNKCSVQYIGSTNTKLKVRFRNKKSTIATKKRTCEVTIHFNQKSHNLHDYRTNYQRKRYKQEKLTGARNYVHFNLTVLIKDVIVPN